MIKEVTKELLVGRLHHTTKENLVWNPKRHRPGVINKNLSMKPDGLWYSVDSEWWDWCIAEEFDHIEEKRIFKLDIDTSDFLMITSLREFDAFCKQYVVPFQGTCLCNVEWSKVVTRYKGIEIAPYRHERRFGNPRWHFWYYGWDVASGCLWDYTALKGIELIHDPEV